MVVYKFATVLVALLIIVELFDLWRLGRIARSRVDADMNKHRSIVFRILGLTLVAVGLIEYRGYVSPDAYAISHLLFAFHLSLVALLVVTCIAIMWRYDGRRRPDVHANFGYSFLAIYLLVFVTGSVLLYQLP